MHQKILAHIYNTLESLDKHLTAYVITRIIDELGHEIDPDDEAVHEEFIELILHFESEFYLNLAANSIDGDIITHDMNKTLNLMVDLFRNQKPQ